MEDKVCLYIATHNITGKKYFGKTVKWFTQEDLQKNYHGSGADWRQHLKEHTDDVTMEVYGIFSLNAYDEDYVVPIALRFSYENNIFNSLHWMNMVPENGLDGGVVGRKIRKNKHCNFCLKHLYPSEEMYHFEYCYENPNRLSREVNCQYCGILFKDNTGLKNHELICKENPDRRIYNCQYCNKEYKDHRNRIRHELTCSQNENKELYFCQYCNTSLKNKSAKIKHENQCELNPDKRVLIYYCKFCGKEFIKSKLNLTKHEKHMCLSNPDVVKLELKCACGRIFSDNGNFAQHQKKCILRVNS